MRILLCHNEFIISGGGDIFFREVGRVLEENGHEVAYFSTADKRNDDSPWSDYFYEPVSYLEGSLLKRILKFHKNVYSFEAKAAMRKILNDFKPDIVHSFAVNLKLTPSVLQACKEYGVPLVMSCNDYKHICPNYKLYYSGKICFDCQTGKFYSAIKNICCKNSIVFSVASTIEAYCHSFMNIFRKNVDKFLFASRFMAERTEDFWGADTFKWDILRNPFDSTATKYSENYDDYILFFGRFTEEKGLGVLLKAMKLAPEVKLKIIGDGAEEQKLKQFVSESNLQNVEFLGSLWGEELDAVLSRARFVVVPSVWHENFPYVILQSFAFGKAVVGSDRGGITELVRDGEFGFIYEAMNHEMLAKVISDFWSDRESARIMGKAAKVWCDEEFNDNKFYTNIMKVYGEVLN